LELIGQEGLITAAILILLPLGILWALMRFFLPAGKPQAAMATSRH
jgi:hypothetical protein